MYLCVVIQPFFFQIGSEETSISGSQVSEPGVSESDFAKGGLVDIQSESIVTVATAQRYVSLFFALCPKVQRFAFLNIPLPQAEEHEKQHSASFFIIFLFFYFLLTHVSLLFGYRNPVFYNFCLIIMHVLPRLLNRSLSVHGLYLLCI